MGQTPSAVMRPDSRVRLFHIQTTTNVIHLRTPRFPKVNGSDPLAPLAEGLVRRVAELGGVLDGQIERGMVFTIPIAAGFPAIESVFNEFVSSHPGTEWLFSNVYDPRDGVTPLNWWVQEQ